jgi:Asp-tRNA(Asn)/Glu-tRNA(Gln) amidotransferase A subunit family amidase
VRPSPTRPQPTTPCSSRCRWRGAGGLGWSGDPAFNLLWTALHAPAVSVPAGFSAHGLPLGVQIVTAPGTDAAALRWAEWMRQALG